MALIQDVNHIENIKMRIIRNKYNKCYHSMKAIFTCNIKEKKII